MDGVDAAYEGAEPDDDGVGVDEQGGHQLGDGLRQDEVHGVHVQRAHPDRRKRGAEEQKWVVGDKQLR